jgi:hypothetical protein
MDIFQKNNKCFQLAYFTMLMPKCNGVTFMETHIDCAHPKLFAARKKQLIDSLISYSTTSKEKGWNY